MSLTLKKLQLEIGRLANSLEGTPLADILRDIRDGIRWNKKELPKLNTMLMSQKLLEAVEASWQQEKCICDEADIEPGSCHSCYLEAVLEKACLIEQK